MKGLTAGVRAVGASLGLWFDRNRSRLGYGTVGLLAGLTLGWWAGSYLACSRTDTWCEASADSISAVTCDVVVERYDNSIGDSKARLQALTAGAPGRTALDADPDAARCNITPTTLRGLYEEQLTIASANPPGEASVPSS
jgi:hypothetical protein